MNEQKDIKKPINNKLVYLKILDIITDNNTVETTAFTRKWDSTKDMWLELKDFLIDTGYAVELDWKVGLTDAVYNLQTLKTLDESFKESMNELCELTAGNSITRWFMKAHENGHTILCMDIDSDSYVCLLSNKEKAKELIELGEKINQRFDYAFNM